MNKFNKVDICIVGSGAGGGVVAKELGAQGLSVVVLEAGRRFDPLKDFYIATLNDWEIASRTHRNKFKVPKMDSISLGRRNMKKPGLVYGVGGGTLKYLANYIRMFPHDFMSHTLDGVGTDWPINYDDLAPYYRKVELELGVSGRSGDPWFPKIEEYPNPPFEFSYANKVLKKSFDKLGIRLWPRPAARLSRPFDGRPACIHCATCHLGCMIKAKSDVNNTYIPKAESTGKVEIRPESVVTQIKINSKGKARSVIYFDKDGVEHEQKANGIVISAGSIQSPRLLLNSKSSLFPDGLANSSGLVGKYFVQHANVFSYAVLPDRLGSFRGFSDGVSFDFAKTDKRNSFVRGWSISTKGFSHGPVSTAIRTDGWGSQHKDYMRRNFGNMVALSTLAEQLPNENNRVELDPDKTDHYGMPVPRVTVERSNNDNLMLDAIEKKILEIWSAANVTKILSIKRKEPGNDVHNMGTCRMGNDPNISVVNSFCQSHDVPNLFVIDASCFVTCGVANPSLTIQAIASRASEYIIEEAKKGNL